jgi:hypothetical protein
MGGKLKRCFNGDGGTVALTDNFGTAFAFANETECVMFALNNATDVSDFVWRNPPSGNYEHVGQY